MLCVPAINVGELPETTNPIVDGPKKDVASYVSQAPAHPPVDEHTPQR